MTRVFVLFMCVFAFFSCKKDKNDAVPDPQPEPVKTGTVNLTVLTYDSLGDPEIDRSGVNVSLYQTNFSAVTNAAGAISFGNVPYGNVFPVLQKLYYEGAPTRVDLAGASADATIPCARSSAYRIQNFTGYLTGPDSIALFFNFDRPVPAGNVCKIAVLFDTTNVSPNHFLTVDMLSISSQTVKRLNVIQLPNLKNALNGLNKNTWFNITIVSMSYGIYKSNVFDKPLLLGDSPYFPDQLTFKKNW